jgi:hypothetical protein
MINGIQPLIPTLWTSYPGNEQRRGIEDAYPPAEEIRKRIELVLGWMKEGALVFSDRSSTDNPKPLQDLRDSAGEFAFVLVRDYNGEYAPAIAGTLAGGICTVVRARKPSSVKATIAALGRKNLDVSKCPDDERWDEAVNFLEKQIQSSNSAKQFSEEEVKRAQQFGERLLGAALLPFRVAADGSGVAMGKLHHFWLNAGLPQAFYTKVCRWAGDLADDDSLLAWWRAIYNKAVFSLPKPKKKPAVHDASVEAVTTVQPAPFISYALWIRKQPPKQHTHNMSQDLLDEIVTAIAHVSHHVYPGSRFRFLLFGDSAARTYADLPTHNGSKAKATATEIPQYIADRFLKEWGTEGEPPIVEIADFRDLYLAAQFPVPAPDVFGKAKFKKPKTPAEFDKLISEFIKDKEPRKSNLSYWEQYSFFHATDLATKPRFIIGAESGNMDGFGYCGIPVISVDVDDQNPLDKSVFQDRIGQYAFLTPLWSLLNYYFGRNLPAFRSHLYGEILKYTRYAGKLHASKRASDKDVTLWAGDEALPKLQELFAKPSLDEDLGDVILESLKDAFDLIDVPGDGNCLFRALARVIEGNEDNHRTYRQQAVLYAAQHFPFRMIESGSGPYNDVEEYKLVMGTPATGAEDTRRWGGFVEVEAFALRRSVTVEVYSARFDQPVIANPGRPQVVSILYVNGNHYKALIKKAG